MASAACKTDFTLKTANETLPLVRMIVADIVEIADDVETTRERLSQLNAGHHPRPVDDYSQELTSIQNLADEKSERLHGYLDELMDLNVDPSSAERGFVDFPARRDNREVCLCWKMGESQVMYWHEANEDCGRRRLVDLPLIYKSVCRQFSNPA